MPRPKVVLNPDIMVERPPVLPEPFIKRTQDRLMRILRNVTIEPAMFLIMFSSSIDNIASDQLVIMKSCKMDFGYNDTVCENLDDPMWKEQNEEVSLELNQFNVYKTLVTSIFPVFFSFYLGAWADLFGRKLLFYLFLSAYSLQQVIVVGCAYWMDSKKEYLFLSYLPSTLTGGFGAWMLAINAFLSDITEPENRAFRFGMLHLATGLGRPLAAPLGAYLLRTGGFVCVFTTSLAGIVIGSLLLFWRIRGFKWNPPKTDKKARNSFSPLLIKDAFKTVLKKRSGPNRKFIFVLMIIQIFTILPFFGEFTIAFSYVRIRYNWGVDEYSTYSSVVSITGIVGQAILLPLIKALNINEALVMVVIYASVVARHVIKGFATEPWLYYLGAMVDLIGSYASNINRSMMSTCIPPNELGKVFSVLTAIDNLLPIGVTQIYSYLFKVNQHLVLKRFSPF